MNIKNLNETLEKALNNPSETKEALTEAIQLKDLEPRFEALVKQLAEKLAEIKMDADSKEADKLRQSLFDISMFQDRYKDVLEQIKKASVEDKEDAVRFTQWEQSLMADMDRQLLEIEKLAQ